MKIKKFTARDSNRKPQKQHWMATALKIMLPIFALVFIAAMIYDAQKAARDISSGRHIIKKEELVQQDLARLQRGLAAEALTGPAAKFTIVPPAGWSVDEDGSDGYYDLTFRGPKGLELNVLASEVDYTDFAKLRRTIERKEMDIGLRMHITEGEFAGCPAIFRTCQLETQKLYMVDFLAEGRAHHLLFAAPYELYEKYLPTAKEIIKTYQP